MPTETQRPFFLALLMLAASGAYSTGDRCLSVIKLFSNCYSYSFSPVLAKLYTHVLCANMHVLWNRFFKILLLKFLANFLNFKFGQSLEQQLQSSLGRQASL